MDDLRSSIRNLSGIRERYSDMASSRIVACEHGTWIEHCDPRPKVSSDPLDEPTILNDSSFCIQIVGIDRPILYRAIAHLRMSADIYFNTPSMQARSSIFWRGTSFDIVSLRSFFEDDDGMFKLSSGPSIHPEIRLQWLIYDNSCWNVQKCSSAPHSTMKGSELVIHIGYRPHEVLFHNILVPTDRCRHIFENNPFFHQLFLEVMVHHLTIVLCSYSGKHPSFCFWNTKPFKRILDCIWNFIPRFRIRASRGLGEISDRIKIKSS